jgi:hypothetical protein
MLESVTYFMVLGKPLIMYIGIITIALFLFTASIPVLNRRGINKIPMKWHMKMAGVSILFAVIHGILGLLAYF